MNNQKYKDIGKEVEQMNTEKNQQKFKPFNDVNIGLAIAWSAIFLFILALKIFKFGNSFFSVILLLSFVLFPIMLMLIELLNYHRYEETSIKKDYTLGMPIIFQCANLLVIALGTISSIASYKRWELIAVGIGGCLVGATLCITLYKMKQYKFKYQWIFYLISFVVVIGLCILIVYINFKWSIVY